MYANRYALEIYYEVQIFLFKVVISNKTYLFELSFDTKILTLLQSVLTIKDIKK